MSDKALFFVRIEDQLQPLTVNHGLEVNPKYVTFEFYVEVNGVKFVMTGNNYQVHLREWDDVLLPPDAQKIVEIEREI